MVPRGRGLRARGVPLTPLRATAPVPDGRRERRPLGRPPVPHLYGSYGRARSLADRGRRHRAALARSELDRSPLGRRSIESVDRAGLSERIIPSQTRRLRACDCAREVLELAHVRVAQRDIDTGDLVAPREYDVPAVVDAPRGLDEERALVADRLEPLEARRDERAVDLRDHITRKPQGSVEPAVDSRLGEDLLALHANGLAGEEARPTYAVAPDIHERTAFELWTPPGVRRIIEPKRERRADRAQLANCATVDKIGDPVGLGVVAPHERLHHDQPAGGRQVEGLLHLGRTARVRLIAEDVLAGLERAQRPLVVKRVR